MRTALPRLVLCCACWAGVTASAQTTGQTGRESASRNAVPLQNQEQPLDPRQNQTIERIRIEDAGSRIDELRVGGQTQSITVQPKNDMPAYEVQPSGPRVWNFLKF